MEITVKEAIAELEKRKEFLTAQCDGCWDPAIEMALQALKRQQWIPCAKEQPKKAGRYLITFANVNPEYEGPMVDIAIWDGTVWNRPAAAWMPLPDPPEVEK